MSLPRLYCIISSGKNLFSTGKALHTPFFSTCMCKTFSGFSSKLTVNFLCDCFLDSLAGFTKHVFAFSPLINGSFYEEF